MALPKPGDREDRTLISRLKVIANWDGLTARRESRTATSTSPDGWVIMSHRVVKHSDNNGSVAVDVLDGGTDLVLEDELKETYEAAINAAANLNKDAAAAKIKEMFKDHRQLLQRYRANRSTVRAKVSARAHGSFVDRKRGWIEISVVGEMMYLGHDERDLEAMLEDEFDIDIRHDGN